MHNDGNKKKIGVRPQKIRVVYHFRLEFGLSVLKSAQFFCSINPQNSEEKIVYRGEIVLLMQCFDRATHKHTAFTPVGHCWLI